MRDKKLTQAHHSQVYDNFLIHWKYIKREKVNGKWKYFYNNDEYQAYKKAAINESVAAVKLKNTIKARQVAEKAVKDAIKRYDKAQSIPGDTVYMDPDTSTGFHFYETEKGKRMSEAKMDAHHNANIYDKRHVDMMEANSDLTNKRNSTAEAKKAYEQSAGAKLADFLSKTSNKIDTVTNKIAAAVDSGKDWLESKFSSKVPKPELSDPNGKKFVENILVEDILYEDIIKDDIIKDDIIKDDIIKENVIKNDKIPMSPEEQKIISEMEKKSEEKSLDEVRRNGNVIPKSSNNKSADVSRESSGWLKANRQLTTEEVKEETKQAKEVFDSYFKNNHSIADVDKIETKHLENVDYKTKKSTGTYTTAIHIVKKDGSRLTVSQIHRSGAGASELGSDYITIADEMTKYLVETKKKKK